MNSKHTLYTVPVPSTEFTTEAYYDGKGSEPTIRFGYENDGLQCLGEIKFKQVRAMRTRAETCCNASHIEGVYDTLVEIKDSPWVEEILIDTQPHWREKWQAHHYMIYLDSVGCFEVIAESWAALPQAEPVKNKDLCRT